MVDLIPLLFVALLAIQFVYIFKKIPKDKVLYHPYTWFSISYFQVYGLRPILELLDILPKTDAIIHAYLYAAIFQLCYSFFTIYQLKNSFITNNINIYQYKNNRVKNHIHQTVLVSIFLISIISKLRLTGFEKFAGADRNLSIFYVILNLMSSFGSLAVCCAIIINKFYKNKISSSIFYIVCLLTILTSLFSGSRGNLIGILYLFIFWCGVEQIKVINILKYIGVIFLIISLSVIISNLRLKNTYGISKNYSEILYQVNNQENIRSNSYDNNVTEQLLERLTYYPLILKQFMTKDYYYSSEYKLFPLGSLHELKYIIPQFIYRREGGNVLFTNYMGYLLLGVKHTLDYQVGRIAESFYVLSWLGCIIYPFIYSVLHKYMYIFFIKSKKMIFKGFYLFFLMHWIIRGDNTMVSGLISCINIVILYLPLCIFIELMFERRNQ